MPTGQLWGIDSLGGFAYSDNLSRELRMAVQPGLRMRQFADIKDPEHQGLHKGALFHWAVYLDIADDGGELSETSAVPESNFTITQGTLTITEYGKSVPFTEKLDNLSEQPVKEIVHKVLKANCKKALDRATYDQFALTPLRVAPTGETSTTAITLSTDGTTAVTNNVALGSGHVKAIVDQMKERDIPPFMNEDYYAIGRPVVLRTLKNDLETLKSYTEIGFQHIMRGEIGRYETCRFVEQTNINNYRGSTAGVAWTNAKSGVLFFFGEDTVAEAIAIPEEIRGKLPQDYGRDRGVMWFYLGGFGLCHTMAMGHAQARIIMWDSKT